MKKILAALAALFLAGCAVNSQSPVGFRPANYAGSPWIISGQFSEFSGEIKIAVNTTTVINGHLSLLDSSGELSGVYENRPVLASCYRRFLPYAYNYVNCSVSISGERAGELRF